MFNTNLRIVEIAIKYHFSSQEAVMRSFQRMFSISPGQFQAEGHEDTPFRAMEKKALDEVRLRHLQEGVTLDPVIISMGELYLTGMETKNERPIGKVERLFCRQHMNVSKSFYGRRVLYVVVPRLVRCTDRVVDFHVQ
ncbi:hypothetical protein ACFW1P_20595 [Paenibacillus sp. NPDC058910]|uniref:hypothetical protein n=1 Tax=unclassified Paenibacillus TaxID=185978 RepID=UPI003686BB6A